MTHIFAYFYKMTFYNFQQVTYMVGDTIHTNRLLHTISFDLRSNDTSITINYLKEDTTYTVWIAAKTRLGIGSSASMQIHTSNGGKACVTYLLDNYI